MCRSPKPMTLTIANGTPTLASKREWLSGSFLPLKLLSLELKRRCIYTYFTRYRCFCLVTAGWLQQATLNIAIAIRVGPRNSKVSPVFCLERSRRRTARYGFQAVSSKKNLLETLRLKLWNIFQKHISKNGDLLKVGGIKNRLFFRFR